MTTTRTVGALCGGVALAALLLGTSPAPAGATGPGLTSYGLHVDRVVTLDLPDGQGPCGTAASVEFDERLNAVVQATQAGLTDQEVLDLLNEDDEGEVIKQVTSTTTGRVVIETGGHTYTGRFTQWFGGHFMPNGMYVQTGTLSITARSELGTAFRFNGGGHDVDGFDGLTKMATSHGSGSGCLP